MVPAEAEYDSRRKSNVVMPSVLLTGSTKGVRKQKITFNQAQGDVMADFYVQAGAQHCGERILGAQGRTKRISQEPFDLGVVVVRAASHLAGRLCRRFSLCNAVCYPRLGVRTGGVSGVFGWAVAAAVGARGIAASSSSFAFAFGFAASFACSAVTITKATAIVIRMRAPNFIVAS